MQNSETKIERIFDIGMYVNMLHLSDAKLQTDDGCTFDVHRSILSSKSDYFHAMFCGMDRHRREFMIPGITGECLSEILCYMYDGDIRVNERNITDLMIAANYLLLNDFHAEIKQSIKANMNERNCLNILLTAHHISEEDVFRESFRFIQTRFEWVVQCQKGELSDLPLDIIRSVLSNRNLFVYNETTVWQAIVEWTQKDVKSRMRYVPQLLLTLAMEDIGEELATEILHHEITSTSMNDLKSSKEFTCNRDVLLSFMHSSSNRSTQSHGHRIPLNLHLISSPATDEDEAVNSNKNLYVTYDENPDLWRKIAEVSFWPNFLFAMGRKIFIIGVDDDYICKKYDISVMDRVTMEDISMEKFSDINSVLAIDECIYVLEGRRSATPVIEVYDTANDRWFTLEPNIFISDVSTNAAVAIEKKIYLVSVIEVADAIGMTAHVFDVFTQQWTLLPSPAVSRKCFFALVANHGKVFLMGGKSANFESDILSVEVFDPAVNMWKELPNVPYCYKRINSVVFNDQIIVFDGFDEADNTKTVRWNDAIECWEELDKTYTNIDFRNYCFCSINDVDTIRMITKQNRDPKMQMEKSIFI